MKSAGPNVIDPAEKHYENRAMKNKLFVKMDCRSKQIYLLRLVAIMQRQRSSESPGDDPMPYQQYRDLDE
jgi:hypothetical protein